MRHPKLLDWIPVEKLDWYPIVKRDPEAIYAIERNITREYKQINVRLLKHALRTEDDIDWDPHAVEVLEKNPDNIRWHLLSLNPGAIHLLEEAARVAAAGGPERIDWDFLSANPAAMHLLEQNPDKIDWCFLSRNPSAIHLLEEAADVAPDKINWSYLSRNPKAMHILERNQDKIWWYELSMNPGIFEEDLQALSKERVDVLREELVASTWHPRRMREWCLEHDDEFGLK